MSICNFETQKDFDLYIACYELPTEDEQEQYIIETGQQYNAEFESHIFYQDAIENFNFLVKNFLKQKNRSLQFFKPELKDGYYSGIQTYFEFVNQYFDGIDDMDNEDAHYYFDMNKSTLKRKYQSEINFINKKLLPYIKNNSDFERLQLVEVFSNGEAIYEYPDRIKNN